MANEPKTVTILEDGTAVLRDNTRYKADQDSKEVLKNLTKIYPRSENEDIILFPQEANGGKDEKDQPIVKGRQSGYWAQNYVGFLMVEGKPVSIVSRFSAGDDLPTDFFFTYMLEKSASGFSLHKPEAKVDSCHADAVSMYAAIFVVFLKDALNKGIMKEYVRKAYNDSNVRGAIDVPRHIKQNIPFLGKIAYTQREHSTDNAMTELIRHTIEFLSTRPAARPWLDRADKEIRQIREVTPNYRRGDLRRVIERNRNHPVRHAYYQEYRNLQRICLQILQYESFVYGAGDGRTFGILFDCAALWENYLAMLLKDSFNHPDNIQKTGTQYLFVDEKQKNRFPIYPDFISMKTPRVIADAKYKRVRNDESNENDRTDFFQVLSYMLRFDADTGILLYPHESSQEETEFKLLKGIDGSGEPGSSPRESGKRLVKLAMGIPEQQADMKFDEFVRKMEASEAEFRGLLEKYIPTAS